MTNILLKSHTYTINLGNVQAIRSLTFDNGMIGTRFMLKDNYVVQITCDYDDTMKQISNHLRRHPGVPLLVLDY